MSRLRNPIGSAQSVDMVSKTNVSEQSLDISISQICNHSLNISLNAIQYIENVINKSADERYVLLVESSYVGLLDILLSFSFQLVGIACRSDSRRLHDATASTLLLTGSTA